MGKFYFSEHWIRWNYYSLVPSSEFLMSNDQSILDLFTCKIWCLPTIYNELLYIKNWLDIFYSSIFSFCFWLSVQLRDRKKKIRKILYFNCFLKNCSIIWYIQQNYSKKAVTKNVTYMQIIDSWWSSWLMINDLLSWSSLLDEIHPTCRPIYHKPHASII